MKWMGGWTRAEYEDASADLTDEIVAMMIAEHERAEEAYRGSHGASRRSDFRVERDQKGEARIVAGTSEDPKERVIAIGTDPRTGREVVTKVKEDGTVVKHRKIEDGEAILHAMFGKPKSFQNK